VDDIISRAKSKNREEVPCDYCSWCNRKGSCAAIRRTVMSVVDFAEQGLPRVDDISSITSPATMSKLKDVAAVAKVWVDAVNKHSSGFDVIPNYKLVTRRKAPEIRDVKEIWEAVPEEVFVGASSISFSKLVSVYAENFGIPVNEAKSKLSALLADKLTSGQEIKYWRKK